MALSTASISTTACTPAPGLCDRLSSRLPMSSSTTALHHTGFTPSSKIISGRAARSAHQSQQPEAEQRINKHAHHIDAVPSPPSASYTSMREDPLAYWDTHKGLLHHNPAQIATPPYNPKGITKQVEDDALSLLTAELHLLTNAASDRAEMHSILAQQRDNWNKLFQRMLTPASMTACILSALASQHVGHSQIVGLSLPAFLLNAGSAAMMAIINQFQPSQLAEEQRTAARLFRKLASDIHYALNVSPHLKQSTPSFFNDCKRRLRALDKAFPMPLTPGGLEKFPAKVVPPALIEPERLQGNAHHQDSYVIDARPDHNGWDRRLVHDLKHVATMLRHSDIPKYTHWAQNLVKVNKCLAIAAPCFAASAALLNVIIMSTSTLITTSTLGVWAATCGVLATFAGSFSNDMQLGMVFELYRNSAGYYADVETTINETLCMPVKQRENGTLFRQRIAYQLGRWPTSPAEPVVPVDAEEAGTLF